MKLFFRLVGNGPPVIVLHGLFGLSDNWFSFAKQLGEEYSVYLPDLRNHGQSPHSSIFDFPALEEDLMELVEDNNLEKINLIGHSLGGKAAMFFAIHHPELLKKLVIIDIGVTFLPPSAEHQHLINAMLSVDFSMASSRSDVDKQLKNNIPGEKLRQFLLKNLYWRNRNRLAWRLNLNALNENLPGLFRSVDDETGSFAGPALFIRGGRSGYIPDDEIVRIIKKFPAAQVKTISGAGHWVHADAPGEFFRIVKTFLDS